MEAVPVQDAVYPEKEEAPVDHAADLGNETARGWMNEDASQSGTQQEAGALKDGDFSPDSLEAPSAGETAKRALGSAFANDNRANPGFAAHAGRYPVPKSVQNAARAKGSAG